jgi:hypothetical protein
VLYDEAFTLHPLILSVLVMFCDERRVVQLIFGEVLQINSKTDPEYEELGWHQSHAFLTPPWRQIQDGRRLPFVQLDRNHRLPPEQFQLLQRVSTCM